MLHVIRERLRQGYRTVEYPQAQPALSPRFKGRPVIAPGQCPLGCTACRDVCPTSAMLPQTLDGMPHNAAASAPGTTGCCAPGITHSPVLDMGRCIFCAACAAACPQQRISFSREHRLAARTRAGLYVSPAPEGFAADTAEAASPPARDLSLFARSFKLRQVSAGGCNACEADCNVLTTLVFDLGRFGMDFVASPRHADALVVTGPVSENMRAALWDTYYAMPAPRVVIAVGVCAISGGIFAGSDECHDGIPPGMPVDAYIPGCPPHPWTILDGLLLARK